MSVRYVPAPLDEVFAIPRPRAFVVFFATGSDPSGDALVSAVLQRNGLVYTMWPDPARPNGYLLTQPGGRATSPYEVPSSVAGGALGTPVGVFLSEMNTKWRTWAASVGLNPDSTENGPASAGGPVWVVPSGSPSDPDPHLSSLSVAARAWGWQRVVTP